MERKDWLKMEGQHYVFTDAENRTQVGKIRIKAVRCGKKNCKSCPHERYAYAQYRSEGKVTEKYLGVAR